MVADHLVALGAGGCSALVEPPAPAADRATGQIFNCGFLQLIDQPVDQRADLLRFAPLVTAVPNAFAGKPESLFGRASPAGGCNECGVDDKGLLEKRNPPVGSYDAKKSNTRFGQVTRAKK
ncbi:hypothetical protein GCM10028803_30340 [Larkinella knui]